jgi:amino acid transporter
MGGALTARVLGCFLAVEIAVIVCFILAGFAHPAHGLTATGLTPSHLLQPGVSGVLAFAMASFIGVESPATFAEEGRPHAVGRAIGAALALTGALYLLAALAFQEWAGPDDMATAATDPDRGPIALLGAVFGPSVTSIATVLLGTSALASMSAFHACIARYVFGMARERVLPAPFARISRAGEVMRGGAPLGGSLLQSGIAAMVLVVAMLAGADPMAVIFTWLSTIASVGILALLIATAVASLAWFGQGSAPRASAWTRYVAPATGAVLGLLLISMMLVNLSSLLQTPPGSRLPLLVPVILVAAAMIGFGWGAALRAGRPEVWRGIGAGSPTALTVKDDRLSQVKV